MKKILITGSEDKDLCKPTYTKKLIENDYYVETQTLEFGEWDCIKPVEKADEFDVLTRNMFANWRFNASLLTYYVAGKDWEEKGYSNKRIFKHR